MAVGCHAVKNYLAAGIHYIDLYERLLKRSVIKGKLKKSRLFDTSMYADPILNKADPILNKTDGRALYDDPQSIRTA
jgi:hypothetical protein